ncbi:MAG: hypothetical protein EBZ44_06485 [Verrucomicrobia bacterium]|nr:hypothetical protein [Micrococcales bacterium]NDD57346.1 hypothetical protein [Verrucomicrobiota bacterium]
MAIKFNRSQTFATNGTVTAAGLHNLIDGTDIYQALITDQTNLTSVGSADELLIADADLTAGDAPRAVTVNELFEDALTISTYTNANINNISYGTSTGTRIVSTNASITTGTIPSLTSGTASITIGTIPTLTAGTTTSTAANITSGTIQTLTSSTATITGGTFSGLLNSSTGTFSGAINSTAGTIATGTITNLSTTLVGDLTISTGSATVGTRVAVVNTAQQYSRAHNFAATSLTITSGTVPWDLSQNQVATLTVTTNSTMNTPTNPQAGATYVLIVTQGTGGSNTLSYSTAYKFPGGFAPSLSTGSSQVDVLSFVSNGTVLYGVASQNFS